jgi:hypothetical protein
MSKMDERVTNLMRTLKNPRYSRPDHSGPIQLDAVLDGQQVVFWASPIDLMDYGREIYRKCIDGDYGNIGSYIEPPEDPIMEELRELEAQLREKVKRDKELMMENILAEFKKEMKVASNITEETDIIEIKETKEKDMF